MKPVKKCDICKGRMERHTVYDAKGDVMFSILPNGYICGGCRYAKMKNKAKI